MKKTRQRNLEILKEFITLCEDHNLWYSLDNFTLLGAIRHSGYVPWEEVNEVMMSPESFMILQRNFPKKLATISNNIKIKDLCAYFVGDIYDVERPQPYIKIRVAVPTSWKSIKKYRSKITRISNVVKQRKINIKTSINALRVKRYEGYLMLEKRNQNTRKTWIKVMCGERKEIKFHNLKVKVPIEYERILENWFGDKYMESKVPKYVNNYVSPILKEKEQL